MCDISIEKYLHELNTLSWCKKKVLSNDVLYLTRILSILTYNVFFFVLFKLFLKNEFIKPYHKSKLRHSEMFA